MKSALAAITAASASALAAPVFAAAVHEGNLTGPGFSDAYAAPTLLGEGVRQVTGTGASQAFEFFTFTLPAGAQALGFDFWAPQGVGYSYSAGDPARTRVTSPGATVEEPYGGTIARGRSVARGEWRPPGSGPPLRDRLRPSGGGALPAGPGVAVPLDPGPYLAEGPLLSDPVPADSAPPASVVPLPGAGGMLLAALGLTGLVALGRRRRG